MKNKQHYKKVSAIISEIDIVVQDIKSIKIQWATNIAQAAFKILKKEILQIQIESQNDFFEFLQTAISMLVNARPTEPMLFNGMKYILWEYNKYKDTENLDFLIQKVSESIEYIINLVKSWDQKRSEVGADLIKDNYKVLTHCHSSSVVKVIREAWTQGKTFEMFNTETRPLFQWRLTSQDLLDIWVPTTLITDDTAPYFIDNTVEQDIDLDMVIIGCDAIKKDGSVFNKVGSFSIALSAWNSGIPVYIVWSLTKIDFENNIHIELRDGKELWKNAPENLNIINYAFDTVPAKFITWIITRDWIVKPSEIESIVVKKYPWMKQKIS